MFSFYLGLDYFKFSVYSNFIYKANFLLQLVIICFCLYLYCYKDLPLGTILLHHQLFQGLQMIQIPCQKNLYYLLYHLCWD